jgi:hypothetical protein
LVGCFCEAAGLVVGSSDVAVVETAFVIGSCVVVVMAGWLLCRWVGCWFNFSCSIAKYNAFIAAGLVGYWFLGCGCESFVCLFFVAAVVIGWLSVSQSVGNKVCFLSDLTC